LSPDFDTLAMASTLRPSILDASFVPAQGEDLTLWHDAVKATGAAGISTTFGLALTPIQTYNAAKVACVVTDAGLKLSVSPRFWWAIGNTAGGVLLASPGILWDVIGWGCQRTTLRTALKVGLCGFTVTQLRLGNGELAAGGLFLLSHVRTLSKMGTNLGTCGGRLLTRGMAVACIWDAMLDHKAYPASWRTAPDLGYWKLLPGAGPILAKGFRPICAAAVTGSWASAQFCLRKGLQAQDCLLPDLRRCLTHNFTDMVETQVAYWAPLWTNSLADLLSEDTTGMGDSDYEEHNAGLWAKTSKKGKRYLFKDLAIGNTNDDMKRHAILRTDIANVLVLPKEGARFLKARGISVKENDSFKTVKPEVSQVRMRESLMISVDGATFVPPECYADDEIDAWGKWMAEQFESGTISQSPGGEGYEIEDFTPLPPHEPGKYIQRYRQLMIAAQARYLEVQYEKMATDEGFIDDEFEEASEGESGLELTSGPGLLAFGGKAGKFLTHHALTAEGELTPGAVDDEVASLFG
jgi:hypothetical protein